MLEEELAIKLTDVDARCKSNTHRITDMEKRQDDLDSLVTAVAVMATKQETIEKDVTEIKSDVKSLAGKPGKRWDRFIDKVLWAIVGFAIAYMLSQVWR